MRHVQQADAGYDRSDLDARGIVKFLIGLGVTIIFIHVIVWGLIRTYTHYEPKALSRTSAISEPQAASPQANPVLRFPAPQLQSDPAADLNKYREAVEQQLNSAGWIDQKAGIAHIPIEQAIDLVAQRGLPVRPPQPQGQETKPGNGNK
jgi:hypothetical protein